MNRSTTFAGRVIVICLVVLGFALSVTAQDKPNGELSGGYELLMYDFPENFPAGWYVDVAVNVKPTRLGLAVVGEVGGNWDNARGYGAKVTVYTFSGGFRLSPGMQEERKKTVSAFIQILVGGMRGSLSDGDSRLERALARLYRIDFDRTALVVRTGVGFNVMPNDKIGIRVGVEELFVDSQVGGKMLRLAVGVVLPFGGK